MKIEKKPAGSAKASPESRTPSLRVQFWPLTRLIPYGGNARTHSQEQIQQIAASIIEFSFNNPVLADPEGGIIAGHGRVLAARQLGLAHVPVIVLGHLSENQKRAFMLADNQLALNAGWDLDKLRRELDALAAENFNLNLTGFEEQELKELLEREARKALRDPDQAPEPQPQAITRPGEIWQLGEHHLLCGDGTQRQDLDRLLDGKPCDLVFTDLPYNVNYHGKTAQRLKLANDNLGAEFERFLLSACTSMLAVCQGPLYICMSSSELHRLYAAFTQAGGHWSTYVIWAKNIFTLKPVALVERALENSSRTGDVVLDPFAGSGSTLIACENLGRRARLIEIEMREAIKGHEAELIRQTGEDGLITWEGYLLVLKLLGIDPTRRPATPLVDGGTIDEKNNAKIMQQNAKHNATLTRPKGVGGPADSG